MGAKRAAGTAFTEHTTFMGVACSSPWWKKGPIVPNHLHTCNWRHPLLRRHLKLMKQDKGKKSYNCHMATASMHRCVYWSAVTWELRKSQEVNPSPSTPAHSFKKCISFLSYVMSQHTFPKWCVQTNSCQIAWGDSNLTYLVHPSHSSHRSIRMSTLIRLNQDCKTHQVCRSKMV